MPEDELENGGISRKNFITAVGLGAVALPTAVTALAASPAEARTKPGTTGRLLTPTPKCTDGDSSATHSQMEGPYFKPNSPERGSIVDGPGTALTLTGVVYSLSCKPVAHALLDFWQADNNGDYDNYTFKFRGHQYTDAQGRYALTTIVPGLYPGRTRHIHVKAQAPGQRILTTQLYFPGEPRNGQDSLYDPSLLIKITGNRIAKTATFDFVLQVR
ncbi:dioxygenase family protein [Actinomadura roseirufa]|uniref:dioxygenase family protein n=1 Tax=Actinomadura roseirufa TaxID=2094049 RepID=UPI0010412CB2|nr:dioxygenase [Actinomadura roseirufa]